MAFKESRFSYQSPYQYQHLQPMLRVSAVLRRYDADVPPTAVGACAGAAPCTSMSVLPRRIVDRRTQWMVPC